MSRRAVFYTRAESPESDVVGCVGDLCYCVGGSASGTVYVKRSGHNTNTGWVLETGYRVVPVGTATGNTMKWNAESVPPAWSAGALDLSDNDTVMDQTANTVMGWDISGNPAIRQKYYPVHIVSTTTAGALSLTAHPNSVQGLANDDHYNQRGLYLAEYSSYRLHATVTGNSTSVNSPRLYVQYSDDDSAWSDADAGPATISLATTGRKTTAWTAMAANMQANDLYLRVAQNGGDGGEIPYIRDAWVEFR